MKTAEIYFYIGLTQNRIATETAAYTVYQDSNAFGMDALRRLRSMMTDDQEQYLALFDSALAYRYDYHEAWHIRSMTLGMIGRFEEARAGCDSMKKYGADSPDAKRSRILINYREHFDSLETLQGEE